MMFATPLRSPENYTGILFSEPLTGRGAQSAALKEERVGVSLPSKEVSSSISNLQLTIVGGSSPLSTEYQKFASVLIACLTSMPGALSMGAEGLALETTKRHALRTYLNDFTSRLQPISYEIFDYIRVPPRRRFTVSLDLNFRGRRAALPIDDAE